MSRYQVVADVLFVADPVVREFKGPQAAAMAQGYGFGLLDAGPDVVQVSFVGYDASANAWLDLGTRCNNLYLGAKS
jgi:hypothetical protein